MSSGVPEGKRELHTAIELADVALIRQLLSEKPELKDLPTFLHPSWLHDAAAYGHLEVVELLLELGFDINRIDPPSADSPLVLAINEGHLSLVRFLLSREADPNIGRTLLAAINRDDPQIALELVKLLVEYGADIHRYFPWFGSDTVGFTPLSWAEAAGKTEIADYLRSKGSQPPDVRAQPAPRNREQEIVAYFENHFGAVNPAALREVVPTGLPIAVHVIPPTKQNPRRTLFTTGMSEQAMSVPAGKEGYRFAELLIHLPPGWPITKSSLADPKYNWPFQWLKKAARYPHAHNATKSRRRTRRLQIPGPTSKTLIRCSAMRHEPRSNISRWKYGGNGRWRRTLVWRAWLRSRGAPVPTICHRW